MGVVEQGGDWWTFDLVRDALVEAVLLWRRSPGTGSSPFATDGPWQLMDRTDQSNYDARGGEVGDGHRVEIWPRPLPLSCEEVARRDRVSEWLGLVEKPEDRRLVVLACGWLARGRSTVPWSQVKRAMGIKRGEGALRYRFDKAISAISISLNTAENRM